MHERSMEHLDDAKRFDSGSHILKHWMEAHPTLRIMPKFNFRIRSSYKDCLSRQLAEAVAIHVTGDKILNGKCEYLQNNIARVKVDETDIDKKKREAKEDEEERKRLIEIEKFKADKQLGQKRRRHSDPDLESMQAKKPRIQALREPTKHGMLAIEYWPEEFKPALETPAPTPGGDTGKEHTNPPKSPINQKDQYYLKLYGWTAWWERNTKIQTKPEKQHIRDVKKISEAKKRDFVMKYYHEKLIVDKRDGIKIDEKFVDGTSHKEDILEVKGRGTSLKRLRIPDDLPNKGKPKAQPKRENSNQK